MALIQESNDIILNNKKKLVFFFEERMHKWNKTTKVVAKQGLDKGVTKVVLFIKFRWLEVIVVFFLFYMYLQISHLNIPYFPLLFLTPDFRAHHYTFYACLEIQLSFDFVH